jgi:hypothetical protein
MWFWDQTTSEIIRNYLFVAGGAFGLWLAWLRVTAANQQAENQLKQTELARRDHVAELFNRAVGQLKDKKLEVRLGAILTLEQICKDFPDLSGPVIKLLTTYLQQNVVKYGDKTPPVDVQAVMDILREHKK